MTQELVITQHVPAQPHEVYAAWLTPEGMSRWWWVKIGDTTYAVDGRVGGSYLVESQGAGIGVRGTFTRLEAPTLLELTWTWLDGDTAGPEESVRVDLTEQGGGTLVTVTHLVADPDGVESYRQGWEYVLGNLQRLPQSSITLTQLVPADPGQAYAAWLSPELLSTWWWPGMDTTYAVDPQVGGSFAIRSGETGLGATGTYRELVEAARIVMTWRWESPGPAAPEDIVTVTFAEDDGGTLVTLVHEFATASVDTTNPVRGWREVLASLADRRDA
ncbi:SRPBCC family protein [Ornithinimicrobium faecis]|uniref:SRPBCC domain-containing protein n=1 Tax=Ornithinimicrobium faecis TaxID=2934158 RepID=A0ABY4YVM1_9MICO|nr:MULTISPECIES: SRPBCC family protein [unclassified Ornithinimicrobium]USQ80676.1 SRPBCC domain-containing protein [Ornithinimicrobium sp. HY1793]